MKVRLDFVTNSSSSSYCIVGVAVSRVIEFPIVDSNYTWDHRVQEVQDLRQKGLDIGFYCESDEGMVGLNIGEIRNDETFGEFRQRIVNLINKIFKANITKKEVTIEVAEFDDNI